MAKTTTYYAQTSEIDVLVERFGPQLQEFNRDDKLALRAILALWCYWHEIEDSYSLEDALGECPIGPIDAPEDISPDIEEAIAILDGIKPRDVDGLLEALTAQIREGR